MKYNTDNSKLFRKATRRPRSVKKALTNIHNRFAFIFPIQKINFNKQINLVLVPAPYIDTNLILINYYWSGDYLYLQTLKLYLFEFYERYIEKLDLN